MDFRILGPLEALEGGQRVALGGSKRRAVLALLLLHANETLNADRLIDELWGERPPATAAKTLQAHISRLRKALSAASGGASPDVVITRDRGYQLQLDLEQLDARRFERLLAEGRSELAAGRPHRAASVLEEALSLWRGRPLADLAYEPFAQREIARLDDLRVAALEQLIGAKLALGRHGEVVSQLEGLIGEHPYRERLRGQLMLALYRCDRQAHALQAYQDARRKLVDELGIEPGERLRQLERAILAHDPALAAPVSAVERDTGGSASREPVLGELPTGVVTFMLTDVEGSTRLWETHPDATLRAISRQEALLADAVKRHGGARPVEQGEGDSVVAAFSRASDSLAAALEAQRRLGAESWPGGLKLRVRIALHTGEAQLRGGSNYSGVALSRCARLRSLAQGGQTLLSRSTHDLVADRLPEGAELIDLGLHRLRDLSRPEQVFGLAHPDLPANFAELRSLGALPLPSVAVNRGGERAAALLEREDPVAAIDELTASAVRGDGSVMVIEAAAGLGKTALLAVARERAAVRGLEVASARGADLERDFPFGIVRQLLEPFLARASGAERRSLFDGAAQLAAPLFGAPERPMALGGSAASSLGQAAGAAMHGLYWLVVNLAERAPLLLCIDDAHLGDAASLRWLHYLARRLEGLPLAVAMACRPGGSDLDSEVLGAIAAEPRTRLVRLEPLSRDASSLFVRRALGTPADEDFCAECETVSGGNPFLLGELTSALAREGIEPNAASVPLLREFVPESVARSVFLRLVRLPKAARAVARAVAVLGSGMSLREAAALAEVDDWEAARAAGALDAAAIFAPGLPLDFIHPLLRAAAYRDLPETERLLWHGRAARLLASRDARSERIAAQLLRTEPAGDPWVVARLREAAADAIARADPRTALEFLRRALVEPVAAGERVALLQELSQAGFLAGDASGLDMDKVTEIAADPEALQASAFLLVTGLWVTGRTTEALELLEQALSSATAAGDHDLALRLEIRRILIAQLVPSDALRLLEPYSPQVEPDSTAGRLLEATLAFYGSITGRPASETLERCRRALGGGRLITELQDDDLTLGGYMIALLLTDELELCDRIIEQILSEGRARGSAPAVAHGLYLDAYVAHLRGDLVRAEANARAAAAAYGDARVMATMPMLTALLINTLTDRGELDAATNQLAAAGLADEIPDHWWFGPALWSRGYLRLAQGKTCAGVEDLLEYARRHDRVGTVPSVAWGWASHAAPLLAQRGDRDEARRLVERELHEARAWGTPRTIGQALRGMGLVTGGLDGIELLHESVRTLEKSPAGLEQARALIDLGATLRHANQRSQARESLRRGLALAHRCGARPLASRAAHELRATGAKPPKLVPTGAEGLTASERRIAEMATEGLTNREIAQALFVTAKTVDTHMTHVFHKLDIGSREELEPIIGRTGEASPES